MSEAVRRLRRERPRSRFLRANVGGLGALLVGAGLWAAPGLLALLGDRRTNNLRRFLGEEALPYPLREHGAATGPGPDGTGPDLWDWILHMWREQGGEGAAATLWIAIVAILLAATFGLVLALLGARSFAESDPFVHASDRVGERVVSRWRRVLARGVRAVSLVLRAVPEYVLAFLLLALLGSGAWPAILALAIHNAGILGRLGAECVESLDRAPLRALRLAGAGRGTLAILGALPMAFPRLLLYFFYRFESCVRESTVLGMLGIVSLGAFVQEARARQRYDEMLFLVFLGGAIVLVADLVSQVTRAWIRASPRRAPAGRRSAD